MLTLLLATAAVAACPDGAWPGTDWPDRASEVAASRPGAVADLTAFLFPPDLDREHKDRLGTRTDGVVVVHRGEVVYERYAPGHDADTRHLTWSVSKSFMNALTGIAVGEGRLSLSDSICDHLAGVPEASCAVTVQHLLEFSTGWDWRETYEGVTPRASSVLAMLYGEGRGDMGAFVAGHPLRDEPGTSWAYSSGDTNVLAKVVGSVLAPVHGEAYPFEILLDPLGMASPTWERDGVGTYVGSSHLWATPRDLARFGLLLERDGCRASERMLPEGWVEASTQVSQPIRSNPGSRSDGDVQGRQFWLNRPVPEIGQHELPWPSAPEGSFAALGHWGQSIAVIPPHELVVVRTADDRDHTFDFDEMLRLALALVQETP